MSIDPGRTDEAAPPPGGPLGPPGPPVSADRPPVDGPPWRGGPWRGGSSRGGPWRGGPWRGGPWRGGPWRGGPPWRAGGGRWDGHRDDHGDGRRTRRASIVAVALVLIVEIAGAHIAGNHQPSARRLDHLGYALLVAGALPLLLRRRWRVPCLVVTLTATVAYVLSGYPYGPVFLAVLVSILGAVRVGHRNAVWVASGLGYLTFVSFGYFVPRVGGISLLHPGVGTAIVVAAWTFVALALAGAIRVRTERFAEIARTHAEQARARAEQERRQASEERLQIARELHDVIGHHLSLINVQAGVGLHLMDDQPEQARVALEAIKKASAEALGEVRAVLGALRPKEEAAPRAPAPSLSSLASLVGPASTVIVGTPVALPPEVDRAAYRIVQESLTNVRRHAGAGATARVTITYDKDHLLVRVSDDGHGPAATRPPGAGEATAPTGPGDGIAGMRARARALGGTLDAGPGDGSTGDGSPGGGNPGGGGGFVVTAMLPLREYGGEPA